MKFCLVVPEEFATHYRAMPFEISGLLNWAKVYGGDIKRIDEDIAGYDVYMTNISSTETEYISVIRMVEPDAKVVVCFDYGFDVVNQYFTNLTRVKEVMGRADRIFSVNRNQLAWMRILFPEKEIFYVPHPADTDAMRRFWKPPEKRDLGVGAMWHQYDNYQIQSLEVLRAVERKLGKTFNKCIIGLKGKLMAEHGIMVPAEKAPVVTEGTSIGQYIDPYTDKYVQFVPPGVGWDAVLPYMGVQPWYDFLSRFYVCLDLYIVNSIGRFGIDCAGVGVPLVASKKQDSSDVLWQMTTVDPYEPNGAIVALTKLLKDPEHYARVERAAEKNITNYNFTNAKRRMNRVLE